MADAGCQRVVHGGMAKRALDSNRLQSSLRIEKTGHTQNRVQLEQRKCCGGIIQIDIPFLKSRYQAGGKRVHIHLQPDGESGCRTNSRSYSAQFCSFDCLVEVQCVAPKSLIAERIEAKDALALLNHCFRIVTN